MQIIKEKKYDYSKETSKLSRVSYSSNKTLSLIVADGTHYNFNKEELLIIINFVKNLNI